MSESEVTEKVSATLPSWLVQDVRARVGPRAFSAWLTEAARRQVERDRLDVLIATLEADHGPVDEALVAAADDEWPARA